MYFIWGLFMLTTVIFFLMLKMEPRTLWIGILFLLWLVAIAILGVFLGETYKINILLYAIIIAAIIVFAGFPLYLLSFLYVLFKSGYQLVKNEGAKLTNFLSLSLGIFIILWLFLVPNILLKFTHPVSRGIIGFITFLIGYFFVMMFIFAVSAAINMFLPKKYKYDYIIVLGSGLIGDRVPPLLASRIDKGIEIYRIQLEKGYKAKIIFTGAKGKDEDVSEAFAMSKYAKTKGIDSSNIIIEDKAINTYENLYYSRTLIEEDFKEKDKSYKCILVTNNFHLFRSLILAKEVGLKCDGAGSRTKLYFALNALIREYVGVMYIYKNINMIIGLGGLIISVMFIIIDVYFIQPFIK